MIKLSAEISQIIRKNFRGSEYIITDKKVTNYLNRKFNTYDEYVTNVGVVYFKNDSQQWVVR